MQRGILVMMLALVAMISAGALTAADADKKSDKKEAAFCPVGGPGHEINKEVTVDFEGGKVAFCCDKCPAAFKKDEKKYAANARHQLVATGQLEQKACPISGRPVSEEHKLDLAGIEVGFCCPNCKGKVAKAEKDEEKIAMVFGEKKMVEKAFALKKKDEKKEATK
jgi:YHS domain-containing protein